MVEEILKHDNDEVFAPIKTPLGARVKVLPPTPTTDFFHKLPGNKAGTTIHLSMTDRNDPRTVEVLLSDENVDDLIEALEATKEFRERI